MNRLEELREFLQTMHGHSDTIEGAMVDGDVVYARVSTITMLLWTAEAVLPWIRETTAGVYLNSPIVDPDQAEALKALKVLKEDV